MSEAKHFFLDLIFPRYCLGCAQLLPDLSDQLICTSCLATIPLKKEFACAFCQAPVVAGKTCPFCSRDHYLDRLLVATSYEEPLVEHMLKTMKYRFVRSLTDDIAGLMIKYLEKNQLFKSLNIEAPQVLPVPLHRRRLNWRGFNQAELIAEKISRHFDWPLQTDILRRIRYTSPQADIKDRASRIRNASGLFQRTTSDNLRDKTILLVDDISTTGSTLNECAKVLKAPAGPRPAGAIEVIGLVFARGG